MSKLAAEYYSYFNSQPDERNAKALLHSILFDAVKTQASDVHIEPWNSIWMIRFRRFGKLHRHLYISDPWGKKLVSAIAAKSESEVEIDKLSVKAMDGKIQILENEAKEIFGDSSCLGGDLHVRFSVIPVAPEKEKLVMRILPRSRKATDLNAGGFDPVILAQLKRVLNSSSGLFLLCGPAGSGKSTTAYACANFIQQSHSLAVSINTIEQPVEQIILGAGQAEATKRLSFADALRIILRQDPNVVVIGEIRDRTTAKLAVEAALTGHFVISTIHAQDTIGALGRLRSLSADLSAVADVLRGVLALRLVRKVCDCCISETSPAIIAEIRRLCAEHNITLKRKNIKKSFGCENCGQSGFYDRLPVTELLIPHKRFRDVLKSGEAYDLWQMAVSDGMKTLAHSGFDLVTEGRTTLLEINQHLDFGETRTSPIGRKKQSVDEKNEMVLAYGRVQPRSQPIKHLAFVDDRYLVAVTKDAHLLRSDKLTEKNFKNMSEIELSEKLDGATGIRIVEEQKNGKTDQKPELSGSKHSHHSIIIADASGAIASLKIQHDGKIILLEMRSSDLDSSETVQHTEFSSDTSVLARIVQTRIGGFQVQVREKVNNKNITILETSGSASRARLCLAGKDVLSETEEEMLLRLIRPDSATTFSSLHNWSCVSVWGDEKENNIEISLSSQRGELLRKTITTQAPASPVMAFTRNGRWLIVGWGLGIVAQYDAYTGEEIWKLNYSEMGEIVSLSLSPQEDVILVSGKKMDKDHSNEVAVLSLIFVMTVHLIGQPWLTSTEPLHTLAFSSNWLWAGVDTENCIHLWNAENLRPEQ